MISRHRTQYIVEEPAGGGPQHGSDAGGNAVSSQHIVHSKLAFGGAAGVSMLAIPYFPSSTKIQYAVSLATSSGTALNPPYTPPRRLFPRKFFKGPKGDVV